jgi:cobyrinic acid a,c-diamide synthase
MWRVRVLGYLQIPASVRSLVEQWNSETPPSADLLGILADHLEAHWDEQLLAAFMHRPAWPREFEISQQMPAFGPRVRIAVAQDESFSWCFPEVLDALERAGATLCDFSPLRSERLPENTDLVYIGCGHPERYAEDLARNHCLMQSLRTFSAGGGRIYAEASGAAYLSRQIVMPDGTKTNMSGLLPINARYSEEPVAPEQAEVTFGLGCWLADRMTTLRGYRATQWQLEPCGAMLTYAEDPRQRCDILGRGNVIASRILFNVAAYPALLERFVSPCIPVGRALRVSL